MSAAQAVGLGLARHAAGRLRPCFKPPLWNGTAALGANAVGAIGKPVQRLKHLSALVLRRLKYRLGTVCLGQARSRVRLVYRIAGPTLVHRMLSPQNRDGPVEFGAHLFQTLEMGGCIHGICLLSAGSFQPGVCRRVLGAVI